MISSKKIEAANMEDKKQLQTNSKNRKGGTNGEQETATPSSLPDTEYSDQIETYSDERIAEFLLTNAVDEKDYERAKEEVRRMRLYPQAIPHRKSIGV